MTGNGKCNYFNSDMNISHYHSDDISVLKKIINENSINEALKFLEGLGIFPSIKNGYFYPKCKKASFVNKALYKEARLLNVKIEYGIQVIDIIKEDKFTIKSIEKDFYCDKLVLATGSKAYSSTGSDGRGYEFLKKFGHTVINPLPSLVPLLGDGKYFNIWNGARSEAIVSLYEEDNYIKEEKGEVQFTDYGLSGICIFNLSSLVTKGLQREKKEEVFINFLPWLNFTDIKEVVSYLEMQSERITGRTLLLFLQSFVEEKIARVILRVSNIDDNKYFDELNKKEKYRLAENLFSFKVKITGSKGFDFSQVCSGGLCLNEINPLTMESLKISGLYIVGELLDVNGDCGGYNLAFSFISGMCAGRGIGHD